ncbi:hypothetical protein CC86DRAFT_369332 [Ophiobolus disseminans]|uniref:Uncharacterized protein n=1 Tax=Ophiobolus disseminans TaxID=1469910 RepID=A0A6A7A618_9PLEO|nr:hypothetical protein CC86DRAFT_369332 [Ophiobolus disseminans]
MDLTLIARSKRDHDDFLAGASGIKTPNMLSRTGEHLQQDTRTLPFNVDAQPRKKLKIYIDPTGNVLDESTAALCKDMSQQLGAGKDVPYDSHHDGFSTVSATNEDFEMEDSDMETSPNRNSGTQQTALVAASPATSNIRANDLAKNPYAPAATDANALNAYLQEVGNRNLYMLRTPLETPDSKLKEIYRTLIFNRVFRGLLNSQCIPLYNEQGGAASSDQAVSKQIHRTAPAWFNEENVVLPWIARDGNERKRLEALGLNAANFPILNRSSHVGEATHRSSRKPESKPSELTTEPAIVTPICDKKRGVIELAMHEEYSGCATHQHGDSSSESGDSNSDDEGVLELEDTDSEFSEPDSEYEAQLAAYEEAMVHKRAKQAVIAEAMQEKADKEDKVSFPDCMRDRVRAALNVFGKDLASFSEDGKACTLSSAALIKYCGIARAQHGNEIDMDKFNPMIVRAFINAISPCPGNGLPVYDYDFRQGRFDQGVHSDDVLGVMNFQNVAITAYVWNMDTLLQMYEFAVVMDCEIVQDMVVDKIREMYAEDVEAGTAHNFYLPTGWMNELDPEEDEALLWLLVDVLIDRCSKGVPSPGMNMRPHVAELGLRRTKKDCRLFSTQEDFCAAYHLHGNEEPCYKDHMLKIPTTKLIAKFYAIIAHDAFIIHAQTLSSIPARDFRATGRQIRRHDLMKWSHATEKSTALGLLKLETLKKHKHLQRKLGNKVEMKFRLCKRVHEREVKKAQWEHYKRWNCFDGDHVDCEHDEVKKKKKGGVISLVRGCEYRLYAEGDEEG